MPHSEAAPASPRPEEEKRQPRQSRLVKAALGCQRLGRFDVTLRNVSLTGIGGQAPHILQIGERMTVFLPGHKPMPGTVRWVAGKRFGIQTDGKIQTTRLRAAEEGQIIAADSRLDFQIIPPPKADTWRPGLTRSTAMPGHIGRKR
ncbi:MAG: PilZ domain-containing protein [Sphingopyxis sp.]|jgi:hypothetical protein|uniref:PilZ domain-containing protein n=1 Tax=Sphingopyxis sp. TaxID=1908224 RepID=UPI0032EC6222